MMRLVVRCLPLIITMVFFSGCDTDDGCNCGSDLFPDPLLELLVREQVGNDFSPEALATITEIELNSYYNQYSIRDLTGIGNLPNLTALSIPYGEVEDISPLADCPELTSLSLHSNQVRDLSAIRMLFRLKTLSISYNQITDLNPLLGHTTLERLYVYGNPLPSLEGISAMPSLERLVIGGGSYTDLSGLHDLPSLKELSFRDIDSLESTAGIENLTSL